MTKILAFCGRKSSGKNTAANFIIGKFLVSLGIVQGTFSITENGELYITDIDGDTDQNGIFDINNPSLAMQHFLAERLDQFVRVYSFADLLKKEVCIKILGLTWEQCYGTDEQKNTLTGLLWENMPGVVTPEFLNKISGYECSSGFGIHDCITPLEHNEHGCDFVDITLKENPSILNGRLWLDRFYIHTPGQMTGREVMQYVGSNIFRKMSPNCWVNSAIERIRAEAPELALILDCRFPNEVMGVVNFNEGKKGGGICAYLTRNPYNDQHISETALDPQNFDHKHFKYRIDNAQMTIEAQNTAIDNILKTEKILINELDKQ